MTESHRLPRFIRAFLAARFARPIIGSAGPAQHRKACLYKVDRIGDFVLATGALEAAIDHFGAKATRLVVSAEVSPFAALEFPEIDRWTLPANPTGLWRTLRPLRQQLANTWSREQFDHLVSFRHARSLARDLSLTWVQAEAWHGLGARPTRTNICLQNRPEVAPEYLTAVAPPWSHELHANRVVLTSVLGREPTWAEIRPRLHHVNATSGDEIVWCPFGHDRIRDYPISAWRTAISEIARPGSRLRILGATSRLPDLQACAAVASSTGATITVTADASPREFVAHLAAARLVLTVESAAAHIATALDKPAVILVGGGHFGWFAPWGESRRQRWVNHRVSCYGCNWECHRSRVECVTDIAPTLIAQALREVLHE